MDTDNEDGDYTFINNSKERVKETNGKNGLRLKLKRFKHLFNEKS